MHARTAERGFTLIEGMTVLGIMTIVLVMVSQIFAITYDVFIKQSARAENETGAVLASRTISDMSRGASSVEASRDINGTTYVTSDSVLVLRIPTIDRSNAVVADSYDYIAFYRHATETDEIWSDTDAADGSRRTDGQKLVTGRNMTAAFRYDDADPAGATRVQVYLVNRQVVRTTIITTKAWTSIFLRNNE